MIKRSRGKGRKKVQEFDRAKEFMMAIDDLAKEKGIAPDVLFDAIEAALISAYRRNFGSEQNAHVQIDRETGEFHVYAHKTVVKDLTDPVMEMALADAQAIDPDYEEGDVLEIEVTPANFGRIAAQTVIKPEFRITKEHGHWFRKAGVWITAIYHPSALLRDVYKRPETFVDLKAIQAKAREICERTDLSTP